ncbi:MAG TPA: pitrilysin family protein, partial [Ilumatobacteraceae bacterium]
MLRPKIGLVTCAVLLLAACTSSTSGSSTAATAVTQPAATSPASPSGGTTGATGTASTTTSNGSAATSAPSTSAPATIPAPAANPTFAALPDVSAADPDLKTGVLPNGLTYYIRHNDNPGGSAELRLAVDAGSARQTPDQIGVAHFLEHMMFNGTKSFPKNALVDVLRESGAQFGADINAYTTYDETVYQLNVPNDPATLKTGVDVLSEWLSAATLDPQEVTDERGVILDEWRSRGQNSDGRTQVALEGMFLTGSVYDQQAPIGTEDAIQQMSPERLRAFYDAWYRPDNAAVVIVGDIDVDQIMTELQAQFGPLKSRGASPAVTPLTITPSTHGVAGLLVDPDLTYQAVELTLPTAAEANTVATVPGSIADSLIFTMIANRLSDDALRGEQPFDSAYTSDNDLVRPLDAPSVDVNAKIGQTKAAMQALLDEFERARRFGFDATEVKRAVDAVRASVESTFAASDTQQDADFADSYAHAFLTGAPILTADEEHTLATSILDGMTPDFLTARFAYRWDHTAPHVMVYGPQSQSTTLPTLDDITAAINGLDARTLAARPPTPAIAGGLMAAPAPVTETKSTALPAEPDVFLTPTELDFANGVTVILDNSPISENEVTLDAVGNGGIAAVAPADVVDARVAVDVVTTGGISHFDQAQLNQVLTASTA